LKAHNVVALEDEASDDDKLPDDRQEVEDEGTAPAVKSGFRPGPKKDLKSYTILIVLPGDEDLKEFQELTNHNDFVTRTRETPQTKGKQELLLSVKTTTFADFQAGKKEDTYDFVGLAYLQQFTKEDLEKQRDYIRYYTQVPVVHVFLRKAMEHDQSSLSSSFTFLMDHFENRLGTEETYLPKKAADAVGPFLLAIKKLGRVYETKKEEEVRKAFDKFDRDASGAIDLKELGELSKDLGHPLTKRQLEQAFKDLDLNHDGVVDFEEFARWYFTGMKPYNGTTRSMLQVAHKTASIFEALKKEDIANILHKDQRLTKHNVLLSLNDPPDGQRVQVKVHVLGPETARLQKDCLDFKQQFAHKFKVDKRGKYLDFYVQCKVKIKKTGTRKLKQVVKDL
jgi:hypothetical protein